MRPKYKQLYLQGKNERDELKKTVQKLSLRIRATDVLLAREGNKLFEQLIKETPETYFLSALGELCLEKHFHTVARYSTELEDDGLHLLLLRGIPVVIDFKKYLIDDFKS